MKKQILIMIAFLILGLATIQTVFAVYVFYSMTTEYGYTLRETGWVLHFELIGSILIAAAIMGLLIGYGYTKLRRLKWSR